MAPWRYRRNADAAKAGTAPITDDEVVCPTLWRDRTIVAYNRAGFTGRRMRVPTHWVDVTQVKLSRIALDGLAGRGCVPVDDGVVTLTADDDQAIVISA